MSTENQVKKSLKDSFRIARDKRVTPFEYPKLKKQLLVVSDNYKLLNALTIMAEEEGAQIRHARPHTPDILVFSAAVKIIDRSYLGKKNWDTFCEYVSQVNDGFEEIPSTNIYDSGASEEHIYDDTPVIIIDPFNSSGRDDLPALEKALGEVLYINQHSVELIVQATRRLIRQSETFAAPVRALKEVEVKDLEEGRSGKRIF